VSVIQERDRRTAADLPGLVSRYVERNVSPDTLHRKPVRFSQVGEMQLKPGRWSPFRAEQEMAVEAVGFMWRATFRPVPFVPLRVRDWYRAGAAGLDARLWGLLPVVHARGRQIARGEAIRYLVELPLAPQAMALNTELEWRAVDESTAEVTTLAGGERVIALLHFDDAGDIVAASAEARPRMVGKQVVDTPLRGLYGEYREFDGARLPTTAEVSWLLPSGPFTYFRCRITEWSVENRAELRRVQR
jgi:Family of unknown function (DUF6920)